MDRKIRDRLEEYLAGELSGGELAEFESRLERDPESKELVGRFRSTAKLFDAIRVDDSEAAAPEPGFYARVERFIEQEKRVPFWGAFLQPFVIKRLAFAALMWLLLLGSAALLNDASDREATQLADRILQEQPAPQYYYVRMGPNLEQNRNSMLAVMITPAEPGD